MVGHSLDVILHQGDIPEYVMVNTLKYIVRSCFRQRFHFVCVVNKSRAQGSYFLDFLWNRELRYDFYEFHVYLFYCYLLFFIPAKVKNFHKTTYCSQKK